MGKGGLADGEMQRRRREGDLRRLGRTFWDCKDREGGSEVESGSVGRLDGGGSVFCSRR